MLNLQIVFLFLFELKLKLFFVLSPFSILLFLLFFLLVYDSALLTALRCVHFLLVSFRLCECDCVQPLLHRMNP